MLSLSRDGQTSPERLPHPSFPLARGERSVSLHPHQSFIAAILKFCINILVSRRPYLVGALICISLMANGIGCLCRCVFAIRLSFVKCLFMCLAHFLSGLFPFLLSSFECSLHILVRNPLSDTWFANMSPSLSVFMPKLSLLIF